jgi:hypothetical protein
MVNPYSCDRCNRKYAWTISDRIRAVQHHQLPEFLLILRTQHESQCPVPNRLVMTSDAPDSEIRSSWTPSLSS